MKINELEKLLDLPRANIRFYEKEGLLQPKRQENGYREYSSSDIAILKKIIIFRKLGFSLPDIKCILDGTLEISNAMEQNIEHLSQQIQELNGALEVCRIIKKDASLLQEFNENYYFELITSKEKSGASFMELAKDYLELEKKSFLAMWEGVFSVNARAMIKKYNWKLVLLALLGICIIRGIVQEFFFPYGNFFEGFSYPFFLFGTISLLSIPIFLLHRKYKDFEGEEELPTKHPHLINACKWIGGFAYFVSYLLFIPDFAIMYLSPMRNHPIHCATFDFFVVYWLMGMYVLFIFVYLYSKYGVFPDRIMHEEGIKANMPRKAKRKIALLSVLIFIFSLFPSIYWYDCFTEEGLIVQRLFYKKTYTWEEIDYYTMSAGFDGTLTYSVVMLDGTKADCIGGGAMIGSVEVPKDKYPEYDSDFVKYLSKKFTEQGIELKIDNWDKLYRDLDYESWIELADDIRKIAKATTS